MSDSVANWRAILLPMCEEMEEAVRREVRPFEARIVASAVSPEGVDVFSRLQASFLSNPDLRQAYEVLYAQLSEGKPCDLATLKFLMKDKPGDEVLEDRDFIDLASSKALMVQDAWVDVVNNAKVRLDLLLWIKERFFSLASGPDASEGNHPTQQIEGLLDGLRTLHENIGEMLFSSSHRSRMGANSLVSIEVAHQRALERQSALTENRDAELSFRTHIGSLDNVLTNLPTGEIVVVGGNPGTGKSSFLLSIAREASLAALKRYDGEDSSAFHSSIDRVLVVSLELEERAMMARLLSGIIREEVLPAKTKGLESCSPFSYQRIVNGNLNHTERAALLRAQDHTKGRPLTFLDHIKDNSVESIAMAIRLFCMRSPRSRVLVLIDYVQLMVCKDGRGRSRNDNVEEIMRKLKMLAKELDIAIVLASQLSRENERRSPPRPRMTDLRDSGAIEATAHAVILLYREWLYRDALKDQPNASPPDENSIEAMIVKNRNGEIRNVLLYWDPSTGVYKPYDDPYGDVMG